MASLRTSCAAGSPWALLHRVQHLYQCLTSAAWGVCTPTCMFSPRQQWQSIPSSVTIVRILLRRAEDWHLSLCRQQAFCLHNTARNHLLLKHLDRIPVDRSTSDLLQKLLCIGKLHWSTSNKTRWPKLSGHTPHAPNMSPSCTASVRLSII